MLRKFPPLVIGLVAVLTGCVSTKQTGYLDIGNRVDFRQLVNQYGTPYGGTEKLHLVLYANSMAANRLAHNVLTDFNPSCLKDGTVAFVGNVSAMPSFITRIVAVPKMRDYVYPVWLDYDGQATDNLPVQADQVSMIDVEDGRLTSIGYAFTEEGLSKSVSRFCQQDKASKIE